jgi:uncharacterized protein (DUF1778 family)
VAAQLAESPEPVRTRRQGYQVHLNAAEAAIIDAACTWMGMMRSSFMRQAALEKAAQPHDGEAP